MEKPCECCSTGKPCGSCGLAIGQVRHGDLYLCRACSVHARPHKPSQYDALNALVKRFYARGGR